MQKQNIVLSTNNVNINKKICPVKSRFFRIIISVKALLYFGRSSVRFFYIAVIIVIRIYHYLLDLRKRGVYKYIPH